MICESFSCTPDVALQQDAALALGIIEYRMAREAKQMHDGDMERFAKHPAHVRLWREMLEAEDA